MHESNGRRARTRLPVVVNRRHLLRLAGVSISGGAAMVLLPTDAAAGWRNIRIHIANTSGRKLNVETWGEDGGAFKTHYSRSAKDVIPGNVSDKTFYIPSHEGAAWIEDYILLLFHNPLLAFPSASINFGGTFGADGWGGGSDRRTVDGDALPSEEGHNPIEGDVAGTGLYFRIARSKDSSDAIEFQVSIAVAKGDARRPKGRKPGRKRRRGRRGLPRIPRRPKQPRIPRRPKLPRF